MYFWNSVEEVKNIRNQLRDCKIIIIIIRMMIMMMIVIKPS